jgi:hypothetical protein
MNKIKKNCPRCNSIQAFNLRKRACKDGTSELYINCSKCNWSKVTKKENSSIMLEEKKKVEKCPTCSHSSKQHSDVDTNNRTLCKSSALSSDEHKPPKQVAPVAQVAPTKPVAQVAPPKPVAQVAPPKPVNQVVPVVVPPKKLVVAGNFRKPLLW